MNGALGNCPMNELEDHIRKHRLQARKVMDQLQDAGKVSDECVTPSDVAPSDAIKAVKFLKGILL